MKQVATKTQTVQELHPYLLDYLRQEVLTTLHGCAPMTVDELVQAMTHFRWMEVLSVITMLRQEGRLGLEEQEGRIRIFLLDIPTSLQGNS